MSHFSELYKKSSPIAEAISDVTVPGIKKRHR